MAVKGAARACARDGSEGGGGATLSEATEDLTKASGSSAALAIMRTEAVRRGCDGGTRALTASEEAEATERSNTRDSMDEESQRAESVRYLAPCCAEAPSALSDGYPDVYVLHSRQVSTR